MNQEKGVLGKIFGVVFSPIVFLGKLVDKHFLAYLFSRALRDKDRIYSIKFIWYGDAVYLHPMTWGSAVLFFIARPGWQPDAISSRDSWLLLIWFIVLAISFLAVIYNFDVIRMSILIVGLVAVLGLAYMSTQELKWNPFGALFAHVKSLEPSVSPGFYMVSCYLFTAMITAEVAWAWLFHRVEIDESYVYEHAFLQGTTREPIFARGLKRSTKDLLELLLMGAGDIEHRTRNGFKRFKNVPFASLWLGTSIDSLLDYRRRGQVILERKEKHDEAEDARVSDAFPDEREDDGHDNYEDDTAASDDL